MKLYYAISGGKLVPTDDKEAKIRIFTIENDKEREEIIKTTGIDNYDIDAALDPDEISRVEFSRHLISIIWKRPYRESESDSNFNVSSAGLFICEDILTIIIGKENAKLFSKEELQRVNSVGDVILKYFFYAIRKYLAHLKEIKKATLKLESKISSSLENKAFLQMFDLSESLIYYLDAIEANGAVLTKLRSHIGKIKGQIFSPRQIEFLDNIILENKQCARQAQIYSSVLTGLMDARGNIINNNMNVLLKNLTLLNVIFLPLNLIAGMLGMSEYSRIMDEHNINWKLGYVLFTLAMVFLSWLMWYLLKKVVSRNFFSSNNE